MDYDKFIKILEKDKIKIIPILENEDCLDVKYISFMDADDEMCKDKLKLVTDIMEKYNADMGLHSFSNGSSKNKCSKGKAAYKCKSFWK